MDYYDSVLQLVQQYAGLPMGSLFGLDAASCFYISHALIFFSTAFVIAQLLNFAGEHYSG